MPGDDFGMPLGAIDLCGGVQMIGYSCYLFDKIPASGRGWTLAVFAVSLHDARNYIKTVHGSGHFASEITRGKVSADCGATTARAESVIANGNANLMQGVCR